MPERIQGAHSLIYHVERHHYRSEGKMAIPVAGATDDTQAMEIVQLHSPVEFLIVAWVATKIGQAPDVPHPTMLDTNNVFLWGVRSAAVPPQYEGGGHIWGMAGTYYYALSVPTGLATAFPTGRMPWETITANDNKIPATIFRQDILEGGERPSFLGVPIVRPNS